MATPFPYIFIRYAALPCNSLQCLHLPGTARFIRIQEHTDQALATGKTALCEILYQLISVQTNDSTRTALINLKRQIYNNKPVIDHIAAPITVAHADIMERIHQYNLLLQKRSRLRQEWQLYYDKALQAHRRHVQQLSACEGLQQGLLLSSLSLYAQLADYRKKAPADFRHKELKTEHGLLRYLTRMVFKTSPFSTFTSTGYGELKKETGLMKLADPAAIQSSIRCNNKLYTYMHDLLLNHPELKNILLVKRNDTAVVDKEVVRFLVNYYNIESIQQLPATPFVQWIFQYFEERGEVSLKVLNKDLIAQVGEDDCELVKASIEKLIETGLLEVGTPTSGLHPNWDDELNTFLQSQLACYPQLDILCSALEKIRSTRHLYQHATATERYQLLQQTTGALNKALQQLQWPKTAPVKDEASAREIQQACLQQWQAGKFTRLPFIPHEFSPASVFFEDCSVTTKANLPQEFIQQFVAETQAVGKLLLIFDPLQRERNLMRDFFMQHYGANATVPVLQFYHTYFLKEKKQQLQQASDQKPGNEHPDDVSQQLLQQVRITQSETAPYTIHINAQPDVTNRSTATAGSMAMFVQFFREENQYKGVVNHFLPGMGKVAGRFLYLFEEQVTQTFIDWNNKLHPGISLMELSDGSIFNANIHPPLLSYELHIPGSQHNYPAGRRVGVNELEIKYDAATHCLYLYHQRMAARVYAFDLSLESFYRRSHFYQLLAHFNTDHRISLKQFNKAVDNWIPGTPATNNKSILYKPRIVFEQDVVLRRAGWVVSTDCIPVQDSNQTEAAWFTSLNTWRIQHRLPEQVFVYLRSPYIPETGNKGTRGRDDYKPQYIHFGMPLLAGVFKKIADRSKQLYVEEMLPHTAHWQHADNNTTVTEQLIHWYNFH